MITKNHSNAYHNSPNPLNPPAFLAQTPSQARTNNSNNKVNKFTLNMFPNKKKSNRHVRLYKK